MNNLFQRILNQITLPRNSLFILFIQAGFERIQFHTCISKTFIIQSNYISIGTYITSNKNTKQTYLTYVSFNP